MTSESTEREAVVLLVEDDPGDQELTKRALKEGRFKLDLRIVEDGEEAMEYLLREGRYIDPEISPRPDLILLDLNLPKLDGREVMKRVRENERLSRIPLVVLSTSSQEADILRSYNLGVNSYITKPVDMDQFYHAVRVLNEYWFKIVILPPNGKVKE